MTVLSAGPLTITLLWWLVVLCVGALLVRAVMEESE